MPKLAAGIGGLLGGLALMAYIRPSSTLEAFTRGGIATGSACVFAAPALSLIGQSQSWDMLVAVGVVIGFFAHFIWGAIALFFKRHARDDVSELIAKIKRWKRGA